jgi:hypothetical protein
VYRVDRGIMAKPPPTFASLEGLLDHGGQREGFDIRPTLLRVLTDLYLQKPTHPLEDERYYTELALRLIGSTDVPARAAVAVRLAPYPATPRAVVLRLARDVIDVAEPILRHSPCLTPADLEEIRRECGAAHAVIIAGRARPSAPETRAPPVVSKTTRPPGQAAELCELFFSADSGERALILVNLDYAAAAWPGLPTTRAKETVARLETSALAHNTEACVREVELAFRISSGLARRIVTDDLGEPIVVVAKALQAPRAVLERILLFLNPRIGQSVQRVYELASRYDEITTRAALCLVAIWQEAEPRLEMPRAQPSVRRQASDLGRTASPLAARRPPARDIRPRTIVNR